MQLVGATFVVYMFAKEFFIQENFSYAITSWKKQKMRIGVAI
jgi:hypothetical protein